jgi:hypothetical protein
MQEYLTIKMVDHVTKISISVKRNNVPESVRPAAAIHTLQLWKINMQNKQITV